MRRITKIVAYYRLSTPNRGKSKADTIRDAYGLEVQRRTVAQFSAECNAPIIGEFTEIASGKRDVLQREKLYRAISMARLHDATLVVFKQDRLARSVRVISGLLESGIHFVSADHPNRTKQEILFRAIMDEEEAQSTSERTKRGLQIAKEKGKLLGSTRPGHWKGREHLRGFKQATAASALAKKKRVREAYAPIVELISKWQAEGMTYEVIAEKLNALGYVTFGNNPFRISAVHRVLRLFGRKPVKHPRVFDYCEACGREYRITSGQQEHPDLPRACHRCAEETMRI